MNKPEVYEPIWLGATVYIREKEAAMKEYKVRGIILREAPMGDKDKRLVMLTRENGKIPVLAKGALSPKSRLAGLTQLFCYGEYRLSKGRTFYYIQEGTLRESFFDLRQNLDRLAYATLIMEVAETLSLDGQENIQLLSLLLRALRAMCRALEKSESLIADAFILRSLAENGFYPELSRCCVCGADTEDANHFPPGGKNLFDFSRGGLICYRCQGQAGGAYLGAGALRALRYIVNEPQERVFSFTAQPEVQHQLDEVAVGYLLQQTERRYKSLTFISSLRG